MVGRTVEVERLEMDVVGRTVDVERLELDVDSHKCLPHPHF
jgi:hypothetical protein